VWDLVVVEGGGGHISVCRRVRQGWRRG
jgi:hypothetical protein